MQKASEEQVLQVLVELRNWVRAAAHGQVRVALEAALPDAKSRMAYQMFDGTATVAQIRIACKMSPNAVVALGNHCASLGLMGINADRKRVRLFDLNDFGLGVTGEDGNTEADE
ncbi:hypothetical protein [Mesorhizobium koreense]|uniref:hypothetical protein n=1 Tax=Mesorhizobium koreense TaxID=3074855 RepID=UPI00287BA1A6|nr:hypothetical protein [Mesorhizobium sp. WR6]